METILVINDDAALRKSLQYALRKAGFETVGAGSCQEGILAAAQQTPALIVCDVELGLGSGYQVLDALKQNPATSTIPFIFMTGMDDPAALRKGMEKGADDFLLKPFTSESLLATVEARLQRSTALRTQAAQTERRLQTDR